MITEPKERKQFCSMISTNLTKHWKISHQCDRLHLDLIRAQWNYPCSSTLSSRSGHRNAIRTSRTPIIFWTSSETLRVFRQTVFLLPWTFHNCTQITTSLKVRKPALNVWNKGEKPFWVHTIFSKLQWESKNMFHNKIHSEPINWGGQFLGCKSDTHRASWINAIDARSIS